MSNLTGYETIRVRQENDVAYLQLYRPDRSNAINETLIVECQQVLSGWQDTVKVIVLEGLPEAFCFGADFDAISHAVEKGETPEQSPEALYAVWQLLAQGPFISIACVRGKVNAGGMGFVAACDVVLAEESATFSLSELLFSLMPACVLPFLMQKIGRQKAHYLTLMTQPVSAAEALRLGLVDAISADVNDLLRKHILRLRRLTKKGISQYKQYLDLLDESILLNRDKAIVANKKMFSDSETLARIVRYIKTGAFPWEDE